MVVLPWGIFGGVGRLLPGLWDWWVGVGHVACPGIIRA